MLTALAKSIEEKSIHESVKIKQMTDPLVRNRERFAPGARRRRQADPIVDYKSERSIGIGAGGVSLSTNRKEINLANRAAICAPLPSIALDAKQHEDPLPGVAAKRSSNSLSSSSSSQMDLGSGSARERHRHLPDVTSRVRKRENGPFTTNANAADNSWDSGDYKDETDSMAQAIAQSLMDDGAKEVTSVGDVGHGRGSSMLSLQQGFFNDDEMLAIALAESMHDM